MELPENKKISTNIYKIVKQIKKEHFIKLALQITLLVSTLTFIFIFIFCLVPLTNGNVVEEVGDTFNRVWNEETNLFEFIPIIQGIDRNALYVFNASNFNFILILNLALFSGWISFLTYLSIQKNMVTPQSIKKTIRKALMFNYLKQSQVERIVEEINVNIGIQEGTTNEKET